ncbi:MAG: tRNA lysidine(34) synthetase TilS [Pseudomonadota bacterium]
MYRQFSSQTFLNCTPKRLGVAVSGGGDSMALLDLMGWHARERAFELAAVTLDHGLRPEAKAEIALVAQYCAAQGIAHHVLDWHWDGTGNLQSRARDARYTLIADWATRAGVDLIALGHTKDDVAETFLMRLARQAGVEGLSQMEREFTRDGMMWCRPLLSFSRAELRRFLRRHDIPWAEDPTNEDTRFDRVKARHVLTALAPLGIDAEVLSGVAQNIHMANAALAHYAIQAATEHVRVEAGDVILPSTETSRDHAIPQEVLFRLRRAALHFVGGGRYPPRADAVMDIGHALVDSDQHTLHGCVITKIEGKDGLSDHWRVTREYNAVKDVVCGPDEVWDSRWHLVGPSAPGHEVRALGEAVSHCPNWRETGLPRQSLRASPAIWRGDDLVAAPLAGLNPEWTAALAPGHDDFTAFLIRR